VTTKTQNRKTETKTKEKQNRNAYSRLPKRRGISGHGVLVPSWMNIKLRKNSNEI